MATVESHNLCAVTDFITSEKSIVYSYELTHLDLKSSNTSTKEISDPYIIRYLNGVVEANETKNSFENHSSEGKMLNSVDEVPVLTIKKNHHLPNAALNYLCLRFCPLLNQFSAKVYFRNLKLTVGIFI